MRQMTFEIPEEVAERFESLIPASERSVFVSELLQRGRFRPALTEEDWARICEAANNDPETQQIQAEFAALPDEMTEAWEDDSVPR